MNTPIRILHVDDETDFADLTTSFLERLDEQFHVVTATGAEEAIDYLDRESFDCIVSDYQMPGMDGIELLETIRDEYPDLPFIVFTGQGSEEVASEAIRAGATDYLQKQAGADQFELLSNRITNAIERAQAMEEASNLERIRKIVREVNQVLVRASDNSEIESRVCEIVTEADPYRFALIATTEGESDETELRSAAIDGGSLGEEIDSIHHGSLGTAIENSLQEQTLVVSEVSGASDKTRIRNEMFEKNSVHSVAAVPLASEDDGFGVFVVGSDRSLTAREQEFFDELAGDITHALAAIRNRRKLKNERDQRTSLFENTPDPIMEVEFDGHTPIITDVNTAFEKTFGFEASESVGQPVHEVVVPDIERDEHEKLKQQVFKQDPVESVVRRETESGIREFRLRIIPFTKGDVSKGAYAWYTDITEQKDRERVLGDLHDVTRKFMRASSPEEIASLAIDAGQEILGLPYTHFYTISDDGQRLHPLAVTEEMYDRFGDLPTFPRGEGLFWSAVEAGSIQQYDDVQDEDDLASTLPFRGAIISPVGDYGVFASGSLEPADFDAFDRELASILITQMEAALDAVRRRESLQAHERELERQNERLEEFAGVVSHDLRNPLNVAEGRVGLAREECDSDHLDVAQEAFDRMNRLIERTLTLAQSGQVVGETEPVDLSDLTEQCWQNVDTAGSTLRTDGVPEIEADQERLQHLFENLYRNAVEHGGEEVTVTIGELEDGFYVEDDGEGIPEDERKDIFETGYSTNDDGTGFGLSIVKEIVEAHNWDIRVTTGSEGGARFEITGVDFADV